MEAINVGAGPSGLSIHATVSIAVDLAGNGHSTNGSNGSQTPKRPKKRPRRPDTWKKNVAKNKRAKGESYVSPSTGKTVPSRSTGEACSCRNKCYDLFSPEEKDAAIEAFNALSNKELQDAHLFGLITSKDVKRRRPRQTTIRRQERKASYTYHVST